MLRRRTFLASSLATAAAVALARCGVRRDPGNSPGLRTAKQRRSTRWCTGTRQSSTPGLTRMGLLEAANGDLLQHFMRAKADYTDAKKISHDVIGVGGATLVSIRSKDRGRTGMRPRPYDFCSHGRARRHGRRVIAELGPIDFTGKDVFVWSSSTAFGTPRAGPTCGCRRTPARPGRATIGLPLDGLPSVSANSSQMIRAGRTQPVVPDNGEQGWLVAATDGSTAACPTARAGTSCRSSRRRKIRTARRTGTG